MKKSGSFSLFADFLFELQLYCVTRTGYFTLHVLQHENIRHVSQSEQRVSANLVKKNRFNKCFNWSFWASVRLQGSAICPIFLTISSFTNSCEIENLDIDVCVCVCVCAGCQEDLTPRAAASGKRIPVTQDSVCLPNFEEIHFIDLELHPMEMTGRPRVSMLRNDASTSWKQSEKRTIFYSHKNTFVLELCC